MTNLPINYVVPRHINEVAGQNREQAGNWRDVVARPSCVPGLRAASRLLCLSPMLKAPVVFQPSHKLGL